MKFGLVVRFVILLAWIPVALAQTSTPPTSTVTSANPVLSARSNLVLVPALVRTKSGELVFTLTAKDFTITDDGVEEKVALEENTDDEPLALVIAVETGGGGARQLDKYQRLATTIEAVVGNVPHRIAVVGFDSAPTLLQDFTSDLDVVDVPARDSAAQRDHRPRQPHETGRGGARNQRHEHGHLQHRVFQLEVGDQGRGVEAEQQ
ncbi:MAG: hypothetical protein ABR921_21370 [Candidatus Sulfotelmatobacter sp.]